jgi:hypothetical protein
MKSRFADKLPNGFKQSDQHLLSFLAFCGRYVGLIVHFFGFGVIEAIPNQIEFSRTPLCEMNPESHNWFKKLSPALQECHSKHAALSFLNADNISIQHRNNFELFGFDARTFFTFASQPMSQNGSQQSANDAAQNPSRKDGPPSRFYFFTHLISAIIGGFVGSCMMWLWIRVRQ